MRLFTTLTLLLALGFLPACESEEVSSSSNYGNADPLVYPEEFEDNDYNFDGSISREVLESYLERAVTMVEYAVPTAYLSDGDYDDRDADKEIIKTTGAKFIGRSIHRWGNEAALANDAFWTGAARYITEIHAYDNEVIFQAAIFECVSKKVENLDIPSWAFEALGLEVEDRQFVYEDIIYADGRYDSKWSDIGGEVANVPDITRTETQLWFIYLIGSYVDIGVEAIHWGQISLMAENDSNLATWKAFLEKTRELTDSKARRGYVLYDAHAPNGGFLVDGVSLLDFNSFPMRIKAVSPCVTYDYEGVLELGYNNSIYGKSLGCTTPSGWTCDSLPYLVEFDNFGLNSTPGEYSDNDYYIWGFDDITWLYELDPDYRNYWLGYAYEWLKENDPNGHLQMPATRVVTAYGDRTSRIKCRACEATAEIPYGMGIVDTIVEIWSE